ncbi:uncharacterized protein LOC134351730 isoform X1 [Mobula hypostoma]|uniref:uncharacterized protein LOC134351730 isoform X1 n=1 Tax=Mobula hypostoma TaxID=723540 RepID=UPI002FC35886
MADNTSGAGQQSDERPPEGTSQQSDERPPEGTSQQSDERPPEGTSQQSDEKPSEDCGVSIERLDTKETLFMLLALHMEESPFCEEPVKCEVNKTGIVVCESSSVQRIVAMDCSRKKLHAAQLVTMHLSKAITGCNVYLSRKPCTECAKCLVQGGVHSIFFWPKEPEFKRMNKNYKEDLKNVNQIFRSSSTFVLPYVPAIDDKLAEFILCQRTRRQKCKECRRSSPKTNLREEMVEYCSDCDLPVSPTMESKIASTLQSYNALLNCNHGTFTETKELSLEHVTHSLQLCFLLAARSDDPANGIGAIIYNKQKQYIVGAGYNGYIKQASYGNFPRRGRRDKQKVAKGKFMVHAEVNAILFRSAEDLDSAVLFSSKIPCSKCEKMIIASGIKTVVAVKETKKEVKHVEGAGKLGCNTGISEGKGLGKCAKDSEGEPGTSEEEDMTSENMQQLLAVNKESDVEIMLWEIPSDQQVAEQFPRQLNTQLQSESPGAICRLPKKDDLMTFLALHMERSPLCEAPKGSGNIKFSKTGIAILNTTESNRILTIECSRNGLHAVEQVLLSSPRSLQGCTVYLSRYPCIICAKLLIQGGVYRICYWPNLEQLDNQTQRDQKDNTSVSQLFPEAGVICDMYIPLLHLDTIKKKVSPKARVIPTKDNIKCESFFHMNEMVDGTMEALGLSHLIDKDYIAKFSNQVKNAHDCYRALIRCSRGSFVTDNSVTRNNNVERKQPSELQKDEKKHIHALQLCFLLAARTDSPGSGAGALISQKDCFVGIGYNGFPKGNHRGDYLSSESSTSSLLICAEANTLCFRYKQDLQEATLYTSTYPCPKCMKLTENVGGITKIVCVKPKDGEHLPPVPKDITCWMWKPDTDITDAAIKCHQF